MFIHHHHFFYDEKDILVGVFTVAILVSIIGTIVTIPPFSILLAWVAMNRKDGQKGRKFMEAYNQHYYLSLAAFFNIYDAILYFVLSHIVGILPNIELLKECVDSTATFSWRVVNITGMILLVFTIAAFLPKKKNS